MRGDVNPDAVPDSALRRLGVALGRVVVVADRAVEIVTSLMLVFVIAINGMEIFSHSLFNYSLHWVYEINLLLANWIYYLGICMVYFKKKDIVLKLVDPWIPDNRMHVYLSVINFITMSVLSVIIYYGWVLLFVQAKTRTLGLGIPDFYFSLPVVVGSVLIILITIHQSLDLWLGTRSDATSTA